MVDEQTIRTLLEDAGLIPFTDGILKLIKPAISLRTRRLSANETIPVGRSKFGGLPDVPPKFVWPVWRGIPLTFLAQFNLADVAVFDRESLLPQYGQLYFFTNYIPQRRDIIPNDAWDDTDDWRVLYFDTGDAFLEISPAPHNLPAEGILPTCSVDYRYEISTPYGGIHGTRQLQELGLSDDEDESYTWDVYFRLLDLKRNETVGHDFWHQLLGWPNTIQTDLQHSSEIHEKGLSWTDDIAVEDLNKWQLLLSVGDDDELGPVWNDGGVLYFMIRHDDLIQRRFNDVYCEYQSD